MKKDRLLNPEIIKEIAALGHTEYLCVADCGLPIPRGVKVIDVSVSAGLPHLLDVLRAIQSELVIESYILAAELTERNPKLEQEIGRELGDLPCRHVPHETLKQLTSGAKCVIRTGETLSYANVLIVGGVNF